MRKSRTFRVRPSLDQRLIQAAHHNGRSVSEEIEARIELSFLQAQPPPRTRAATQQDQPNNTENCAGV